MALLDMFNPVLVLRLRLVMYGVLLFFSFFIIGGVASMKNEAVGVDCPLYCEINKRQECGAMSTCNYPMAIAIIFQLLYLLARVATLVLLLLGKLNADGVPFSSPFDFIYVVVDMVAGFFTFIGACILSAGTNSTCNDTIMCDYKKVNDWVPGSRVAQAGAWISFFVWIIIGLIGFLSLFRDGKIPFIQSGGAAKSSAPAAEPTSPPPMETPPSNPDDMSPKY